MQLIYSCELFFVLLPVNTTQSVLDAYSILLVFELENSRWRNAITKSKS